MSAFGSIEQHSGMEQFQIQLRQASVEQLRLVVAELLHAVKCSLKEDHESAKESFQRASAVVRDEVSRRHPLAGMRLPAHGPNTTIRRGLAPWQIHRITNYIEENLDSSIKASDLAYVVKYSVFHFSRVFRGSFNRSPHEYVMHRRIERAKELMLTTDNSLGQIAADCGLADQAHFNKLFRKFVGETPGAWRRSHAAHVSMTRRVS